MENGNVIKFKGAKAETAHASVSFLPLNCLNITICLKYRPSSKLCHIIYTFVRIAMIKFKKTIHEIQRYRIRYAYPNPRGKVIGASKIVKSKFPRQAL